MNRKWIVFFVTIFMLVTTVQEANSETAKDIELNSDDLTITTTTTTSSSDDNSSCSFDCTSTNIKTKAIFPLTSRAFFCIKNTIDIVFNASGNCSQYDIITVLKDKLRPAVLASLLLFMVLLGIKVTTSSKTLGKKDLFSAILKFAFVWYLAVDNGLTDFVYNGGVSAMTSLSGFMMKASSVKDFCNYSSEDYGAYGYLAMWDSIDCRLVQYLLINPAETITYGVIQILIPLIFSIEIIIALFFIVFSVFLLCIVASIFHFFVLALIGLALMTYFGVIFAPMMLFSYTKHFFDNWWKATVSFILQPVVITIFIVIPILFLDQVMYADCELSKNSDGFWEVKISNPSSKCASTLGYYMTKSFGKGGGFLKSVEEIFFNITIVKSNSSDLANMLLALIKTLLFCYVFLLLTDKGGSLAAKLTSGPEISKFTVKASEIFNKAMSMMTKKPDKAVSSGGDDKKEGISVSNKQGGGSASSKQGGRSVPGK